MPPERHRRRTTRHEPYPRQGSTASPSAQTNSIRLACPFFKRYPGLRAQIGGPCTKRFGFDSIRSLNEHLKRDHSLKFGCIICKKRFPHCNNGNIEERKREHDCQPRNFTENDPIWMSPQQELDWNNWEKKHDVKGQDDIVKKWHSIYKSLFGEGLLPSPFYDFLQPRHQAELEYLREVLRHSSVTSQNPSAAQLLHRMGNTLRAADQLDLDVSEILYEAQMFGVVEENPQCSTICTPAEIDPQQSENTAPGRVHPSSSSAFISPWSLDLNAADVKEREKHQSAVQWNNRRVPDSGYRSLDSTNDFPPENLATTTNPQGTQLGPPRDTSETFFGVGERFSDSPADPPSRLITEIPENLSWDAWGRSPTNMEWDHTP